MASTAIPTNLPFGIGIDHAVGPSSVQFLHHLEQNMLKFQQQLTDLSIKVQQLEQKSCTTTNTTTDKKFQGPVTAAEGTDNTHSSSLVSMKEVIRLDGRIDLLNGKINLVKHDLSQLLLLGNQQPNQFQLQLQSAALWDQQHGQTSNSHIKAEPEVLLSEYEGEDGFLYQDNIKMGLDGGAGTSNEDDDEDVDDGADDTQSDPDYKYGRDIKPDAKRERPTSNSNGALTILQSVTKTPEGTFQCPTCPIKCKNKKDLVRHHQRHIGVQSFRCHICNAIFNRKDNWTAHMKKKHQQTKFTTPPPTSVTTVQDSCSSGPIPIITKAMMDSILRNPATGKFPCPKQLCLKEFCHKRDIKRHYILIHCLEQEEERQNREAGDDNSDIRSMLPKGSKECPICQKVFSRREHTIRHMKIHSELKFPCVACSKSYSRKDKLRAHQREKHGQVFDNEDNPYVVELEESNVGAEGKQTDKEGEGDQTGDPKHRMDDIKKEKKLASLQSHQCPDCKKLFSQKSRLDRHIIGCRGLKPYSCEECLKCFTQKSALLQHRAAIHQGIKRFLCSECGSCFYGSTNYKKHVRSHTGLKPYPCSVCGRHFNGKSDLKRHERIHTGIRNFHCNQCDLKFIRRDALSKHMLVHTGEKPWMCDLCGSSFSQSGSMKKHRDICSARVNEGRPPIPAIPRKPRAPKTHLQQHHLPIPIEQDDAAGASAIGNVASRFLSGPSIPQLQHQLLRSTVHDGDIKAKEEQYLRTIHHPDIASESNSHSSVDSPSLVQQIQLPASTTIFNHGHGHDMRFGGY